jgi:hypothetical protein
MLRIRQPLLNTSSQVVVLDRIESTAQVYLPTINLVSTNLDTSDILHRYPRKKKLTKKEEEQIAAQLLLERREKPKQPEQVKQSLNWKSLILRQIKDAETEAELNAIQIESANATAQILAELERKREEKRIQLEILRREAELKATELDTALKANEAAIMAKLEEQRAALIAAKQFQIELAARHQLAVDAALAAEQDALSKADEAKKAAAEFEMKRTNRIKRLKALMWLAKLDL